MSNLLPKTMKESQVTMIELVLPNDTNILKNLLGGRLMHWMDMAAAMAASRHCNHVAVTAVVDDLSFHEPIKLGNIVSLKANVNRAFNTSMEIGVKVEVENFKTGEKKHSNSAYFTFVCVDSETYHKVSVPPITPETEEEKKWYNDALLRREQRLNKMHGIIQK
ncbi:MAG: acyl-CoA thioesterase [Ignavibacteria bacterium]|nr:acyl-CoA thioesterase [Ignavibacteria bacterium]